MRANDLTSFVVSSKFMRLIYEALLKSKGKGVKPIIDFSYFGRDTFMNIREFLYAFAYFLFYVNSLFNSKMLNT